MGSANLDTLLDTNVYEVLFHDRRTVELAVNVIDEATYAQYYANQNLIVLLVAVMDNQTNHRSTVPPPQSSRLTLSLPPKGWQ